MPQSDGTNTLKRIALHFSDDNGSFTNSTEDIYRFAVNPENYRHTMPQRSNVLKTKSSIIVEDYGKDIETITFSGTTGFRKIKQNGKVMNGKQRMDELIALVDYYAQSSGGSGNRPSHLRFYNRTDDVNKLVTLAPEGLTVTRDKENPLMYQYEITLIVLGFAWEDGDNAKTDPEFGNVKPSPSQDATNKFLDQNDYDYGYRDQNNTAMNNGDNRFTDHIKDTDNNIQSNNTSGTVANPRVNLRGMSSSVSNMAQIVGYGNGGVG